MNTLAKYTLPALALLSLGLGSCQPEFHSPKFEAGSADFTRYIAVGNSLTAGFSDGGLYREGQQNSYPSILAQQFRLAGGGAFEQPLFTEAQFNGSGYLRLTGFSATGSPTTANVTNNLGIRATTPTTLYTRFDTRVDNLGVPGIRLNDIHTVGYGSQAGNPYFERITPTTAPTQTYFQRVKAEAATATFFSNWLGNNDVLGYATTGGLGGVITRTDTFALKNSRIINALTANGAKGVVATIPDVTNVPFFTTVRVADVRARFKAANAALDVYIQVTGPTGNTTRLATDDDLITLQASALIGTVTAPNPFPLGAGQSAAASNPIPNQFVLDATEQAAVQAATTAFNSAIVSKANEKGLAIFDSNTFFRSVAQSGYVTNGVNNTASFISGNLFSLDGVHPTPRGYAVVANEMIRAINAKYGSTLPLVNPNSYRGVLIP